MNLAIYIIIIYIMKMVELLKNIVLLLNEPFDQEKLFMKILQSCISYTPAESASLLLCDEERNEFIIKAQNPQNENKGKQITRIPMTEGISGQAVQKRKAIYIPDVRRSPHYKKVRAYVKSEVAVPLIYKDLIRGVLCLDSSQINAFHPDELELFNVIGGIAAQSIHNASMYNSMKKTNQYRTTLIEIGHLLTEGFDLKILFHKVMERLAKQMNIKIGILSLLSEHESDLSIEVAWGLTDSEIDRGYYKVGEGITGIVAQSGKTLGVKNIRKENSFLGKTGYMSRLDTERQYCFICVPLLIGKQVKGTLSISKEYYDSKTYETDIEFMELVSATIAKSVYIHLLFTREKRRLQQENRQLKHQLHKQFGLKNIIAISSKIKSLLDLVDQVAQTNATVLLRGESGTGKELFAHAIHYNSPRYDKPFIKINCGALPDTLLESELFGYVKGGFTGAVRNRDGKFLMADGGTIFLDEIGNTSPLMQVKLLRVLQEKTFEPIGSDTPLTVDVRIIAATNQNLEEMIQNSRFREDLFYRLNVVPVHIPSLRERKEDISVLVDYFISKYASQHEKDIIGIEPQALQILTRYNWPGNVRELENCIEYGIIFEKGRYLTAGSLKVPGFQTDKRQEIPASSPTFPDCIIPLLEKISPQNPYKLKEIINQIEKEVIIKTLDQFAWNKTQSARYLGINRMTLLERINRYKLYPENNKEG